MPICTSPAPGISRSIQADYIISRAHQRGVPVDDMEITGADRTSVTRWEIGTLPPAIDYESDLSLVIISVNAIRAKVERILA